MDPDNFNISDIPGEDDVRRSAESHIINKAKKDSAFRKELLANPKSVISKELGVQLPADFEVKVIEETPKSFYMVLPTAAEEGELSDQLLEAVAGGCYKPTTPTQPPPPPPTGTNYAKQYDDMPKDL